MRHRIFNYWLPLMIVTAWRSIPARVRGAVSANSTSHLALAVISEGGGWRAFRYARISGLNLGSGVKEFVSWTD
jgi:hypothetical protein